MELDVPRLTWKFGTNVAPPSVEYVAQIWTSVFLTPSVSPDPPCPMSLRASYQDTATAPLVWSNAMAGLNWLLVVASSFNLAAGDQMAPWSSEYWNITFMSSLSFFTSCVQIA